MLNPIFVREPAPLETIRALAEGYYGDMTKAVVDIKRQIMFVGTEWHVQAEKMLLEDGSVRENLWGINLYPDSFPGYTWIEFSSMINIRPEQNNHSRGVEDPAIQKVIRGIVKHLVTA